MPPQALCMHLDVLGEDVSLPLAKEWYGSISSAPNVFRPNVFECDIQQGNVECKEALRLTVGGCG